MADRIDVIKELLDLRNLAMATDFNVADDAKHEIELSFWAWDEVRKRMGLGLDIMSPMDQRFWGMFHLKLVRDPLPDMAAISDHECGPDCAHTRQEFIHMALRVEKTNGRFVYFDWCGNNDDFR